MHSEPRISVGRPRPGLATWPASVSLLVCASYLLLASSAAVAERPFEHDPEMALIRYYGEIGLTDRALEEIDRARTGYPADPAFRAELERMKRWVLSGSPLPESTSAVPEVRPSDGRGAAAPGAVFASGEPAARARRAVSGRVRFARERLDRGESDKAVEILRDFLETSPNDPDAHRLLGEILRATGDKREAEAHLARALVGPGDPELLMTLGLLAEERGSTEVAIGYLERARRVDPGLAGPALKLGNIHRFRGRYDLARRCYEDAARISPDLPAVHLAMADTLLLAGDAAEATHTYGYILKRWPAEPVAYLGLARIALGQGKTPEVRALVAKAKALAPKNPQVHEFEGLLAESAGDPDAAGAAYDRALALDPRSTLATERRLELILRSRDRRAQHDFLERSARRFPDNARFPYYQGVLFTDEGEFDAAERWLARAERIAPDDLDTAIALGILADRQRRPESALARFGRALDLATASGNERKVDLLRDRVAALRGVRIARKPPARAPGSVAPADSAEPPRGADAFGSGAFGTGPFGASPAGATPGGRQVESPAPRGAAAAGFDPALFR